MEITYQDFEKVDIRLGTIQKVEEFPRAKKPAYKVWADFGPKNFRLRKFGRKKYCWFCLSIFTIGFSR